MKHTFVLYAIGKKNKEAVGGSMKKGQIVEGIIEQVDFPNKGVLRTEDGDRVIVKNSIPGQKVRASVNKVRKGKCEGRLVSTKPLSRSGQVIDHFTVDFKDGRVVDCHAEQGEEVLKKMFAMDEGASMLGEVALVPKESPINQSGLMFYNTLFDENACCHVAAGRGFSEVIEGFMDMTDEEIYAKGINDSMIHMDFMVGSDDLHIVGIREDGSEVDIFVDGTWAE